MGGCTAKVLKESNMDQSVSKQYHDCKVYVIGLNQWGELGLHSTMNRPQVKELTLHLWNLNVKTINNEYCNTIITTHDDKYICCGNNNQGECGYHEIEYFKENNIKIKQIYTSPVASHTMWRDINDNIYVHGDIQYNQCGILNLNDEECINTPTLIPNWRYVQLGWFNDSKGFLDSFFEITLPDSVKYISPAIRQFISRG